MKEVVMFMDFGCPVCFRLGQMLSDLCIRRGLALTKVEVRSGSGSLMGRYRFLLDRAFGGRENTPVVLVGEERWYVPTRKAGSGPLTEEEIDEACRRLVEEIEKDLEREERAYPATHEWMRYGVRVRHKA